MKHISIATAYFLVASTAAACIGGMKEISLKQVGLKSDFKMVVRAGTVSIDGRKLVYSSENGQWCLQDGDKACTKIEQNARIPITGDLTIVGDGRTLQIVSGSDSNRVKIYSVVVGGQVASTNVVLTDKDGKYIPGESKVIEVLSNIVPTERDQNGDVGAGMRTRGFSLSKPVLLPRISVGCDGEKEITNASSQGRPPALDSNTPASSSP